MTRLDDTSWLSLAGSIGEEMSRRWYRMWKFYYGDWVQLAARVPATRALMAEFISRSYDVSPDWLDLPSEPAARLEFEIDSEAQSAGPVRIPLPADLHHTDGLRRVSAVGTDAHCGKNGATCEKKKSSALLQKNVMVREEGGFLSVTLVGLRPVLTSSPQPKPGKESSSKPRLTPVQQSKLSGDYHLHFEGDSSPIALVVKSSG